MANYKVISDRLGELKQGEIVSEADLSGANIEALIAGEHLAVINKPSKKDEE